MKSSERPQIAAWIILSLLITLTQTSLASLRFNGTDSRAVLDGHYLDGREHSDYTFEVWIKPLTSGGQLIGKSQFWKEWWLQIDADGGLLFGGAWPFTYWNTKVAPGAITTGNWQHVCYAVSQGQAAFYVNGKLVAIETVHDPIDFKSEAGGLTDGPMSIGYADSGTTPDYGFFNGFIYGIRVWERTLAADEIQAIANTGVPISTSGLYNAVMLDEGSGTVIRNSRTPLSGRVLSAEWSSDRPTFNAPMSSFLTNGLVAYYPFKGNAKDESGNGRHGTVLGATLGNDRFGAAGSAYEFTGGSHIDLPIDCSSQKPLTYSVWFRQDREISPGAGNGQAIIWTGTFDAPSHNVGIAQNGLNNDLYLEYYPRGIFETGFPIVTQRWYHLAVVYTEEVRHFVNGVKAGSVPYPSAAGFRSAITRLGKSQDFYPTQLEGLIDDVRIYNRALSDLEIQQLYSLESRNAPTVTPLTNGLVAYYPFNGNANDESGHGNNGAVFGASLASDRFQTGNSAYSFDGADDFIQVQDSPSLNPPSAIAVSAWIKAVETRAGAGIISKCGADDAGIGQWVLEEGNAPDSTGVLRPGLSSHVSFAPATHPQSGLRVDYPTAQVDGLWHHLMLNYDGAILTFYIDGSAVASKAGGNGTLATYAQAVEIGRYYHGANRDGRSYYFAGLIDDVRIYNRALSEPEIQQLYAFESRPPGQPLVIIQQPGSTNAPAGSDVTFQVTATGNQPLTYLWKLNGVPILGASSATLVLRGVTALAAGSYTVAVTDGRDTVTSVPAVLTIVEPPRILQQPLHLAVFSGEQAMFAIQAAGTEPLLYQWFKGEQPISNATGASLSISTAYFVDAGSYTVRVSNPYGSQTSAPALLTVRAVPNFLLQDRTPGGGLVLRDPFQSSFAPNSDITLTARPNDGWTFLDWKDELQGTNPVIQLTMDSSKNIRARFGTSIALVNSGNGSIAVDPEAELYPYGTPVRILAVPQAGNYFAGWSGSASGNANPLLLLVRDAQAIITAAFFPLPPNKVALTVGVDGAGKVTVGPRDNLFTVGDVVTNTTVADPGQEFLGWSGDAQGTENPLIVVLDRSKQITARFTRRPQLTLQPSGKDSLLLTLTGEFGQTYRLLESEDFKEWSGMLEMTDLYGESQTRIPRSNSGSYFKASQGESTIRTASAVPTVVNGFIVSVTITDGGEGYVRAPEVTATGGGGTGATFVAVVSAGKVQQVIVTNAGSGYTGNPVLVIGPPNS